MDSKQPRYNLLSIAPVLLLIILIFPHQTGRAYAQQGAVEFLAGVPANFPPHYSIDSQTGKPTGFAIDAMEEVARRSGIKIRYVVYPTWKETAEAMEKGKVVIIPNMGIIAERAESMDFTSPIEIFHIVIFVRETTRDIKGIEDLIGKEVAVVETNAGLYLMKQRGGSNLQIYSSQDEAFLSLISGKSDALVHPEPPIKMLFRKTGLENRIKIVGEPLLEVKRGIAVRKGNPELLKKLDDEVKIFTKSPRYIEIYAKWYGKPEPYWTARRTAVIGGGLLAFAVITLIVWRYLSLHGLNKKLVATVEERKRAEEALHKSEEQFRAIAVNTPDHIFIQDRDLRYTFVVNPQLGLTAADVLGKTDYDFLTEEEADKLTIAKRQVMETGEPLHFETSLISKEEETEFFDGTYVPKFDVQGESDGLIGYFRNVTESKQLEEKILKLNRVYAVISQINQAIVRTREKDKIFNEACHIAVEYGKFRMAWIGMIDEETKLVKPVAYSGAEEGYLAKIKRIPIADVPEGRGPTGTAIRDGRHYVCDDIEKNPRIGSWREEALKRGYRSSVALPIRQFGKVIGTFSLYASVPDFFDQEEVHLLDEVTNDISFAIDAIETAKKKGEAEEEIKTINEELIAINRIITAITGVSNIKDILEKALDEALGIAGLEGGTICMVTPQNTLQLAAHRATSEATILDLTTNEIRVGECLCGECARDHKPLILRDREAVLEFATREATRGEDIRFHAAFPLITGGKCLGVLCLFTRTDKKPEERRLKLLETVTAQIALSVQNAGLFEETLRNAAVLEERVKERTAELEKKIAEIERMNRLFVNREIRMKELKERIRELEKT